jgi:hypothetical protein
VNRPQRRASRQNQSVRSGPMRRTAHRHRRPRATLGIFVGLGVLTLASLTVGVVRLGSSSSLSPLRLRIVAAAQGQVGYRTDPANSYCNKFSAYWHSGSACSDGLASEEWCADFAAWAWQQAGAAVTYQYINGDLNSSAASFYEWGVAHGTWHPISSDYVPQPGDVAVYGLDVATLTAQHVAVVTGYSSGARGPDVVNGDGDRSGFSVVETGTNQYRADVGGGAAALSSYVSPMAASSAP